MDQLRDQLEWMKGAIARGEVSARTYRAAIRDNLPPLVNVLKNLPLMVQVMDAHPDVVERLQVMTVEIIGELRRLTSEESTR